MDPELSGRFKPAKYGSFTPASHRSDNTAQYNAAFQGGKITFGNKQEDTSMLFEDEVGGTVYAVCLDKYIRSSNMRIRQICK